MGMYTEIQFAAILREDTPAEVISAIRDLVEGDSLPGIDHPFFRCPRALSVMHGMSAYFVDPDPPRFEHSHYSPEQWFLSFRSNLKNYDNEIEHFLAWIKPYVEQGAGLRDRYAVTQHENEDEPTYWSLGDVHP